MGIKDGWIHDDEMWIHYDKGKDIPKVVGKYCNNKDCAAACSNTESMDFYKIQLALNLYDTVYPKPAGTCLRKNEPFDDYYAYLPFRLTEKLGLGTENTSVYS